MSDPFNWVLIADVPEPPEPPKSWSTKDYESKEIFSGTLTQEIKGRVSRGLGVPFRRSDEWRATLTVGSDMEWQWFETEEEATKWVRDRIPEGTILNENTDTA